MLREALKELEKSKEELNVAFENEKELSELKSGFVTMASHEFRTPLSTILSSAYLIEKYNETNLDPKVDKHVKRIKNAVGGMKNILEDFLSLGKLEEGLVHAKPERFTSVDFNGFIQSVISELEAMLKPGQTILYENVNEGNVWIDHYLLKNILINMVSNAIKFSLDDGKIRVITFVENNQLVLNIQDEGIGISDEDQQHLFERFFRAKNAANIQGTGLGLHIVVKYLELLDGRIKMNSTLNEGTTFTIYFPQPKDL
ncbi:MAG: HAMP domain-containing histidine kinase [Chitinophagaceae bacterium]|nr:HAMP domain-containing histidine kinase [Chitinophagaceae bacterium]